MKPLLVTLTVMLMATGVLAGRRTEVVKVVEKNLSSVVGVLAAEDQGEGAGVAVQPDLVVTALHVLAGKDKATVVTLAGERLKAEMTHYSEDHDLALLKVEGKLAAVPLLKDRLMLGETVIAVGSPFGRKHAVSIGVVSQLDTRLRLDNEFVLKGLILTDAAVNPGNSGGPLFTLDAELAGIVVAHLPPGKAHSVGFAIHVDVVRQLLQFAEKN
jgi:serine protease Do